MQQILLIIDLQWRLFINSLRIQANKLELIARIIFTFSALLLDLVIAAGLSLATIFFNNKPNAAAIYTALFIAIFFYWQVAPLLTASFGNGISISRLRLY